MYDKHVWSGKDRMYCLWNGNYYMLNNEKFVVKTRFVDTEADKGSVKYWVLAKLFKRVFNELEEGLK